MFWLKKFKCEHIVSQIKNVYKFNKNYKKM